MDELGALILGSKPKEAAAQPKVSGMVTDELLNSLRQVESGGGKNVFNKESGAAGPYQHIPGTVKMLSAKYGAYDPYNEQQSRERTKQYLEDLISQNKGDVRAALGQYGGHITKDPAPYVNKVLGGMGQQQTQAPDELGQLILGTPTKKTGGLQSTQAQREAVLGPEITPKEKRELTAGEKMLGAAETGLTLGTGAISGITGQVAGIAKNIFGGKFGTQEGIREAEKTAQEIQQAGTYMPRTEAGKQIIRGVGEAFEASRLPPLLPEAAVLASARPGAVPYAAGQVRSAVAPVVEKARQYIPTGKPSLAGVGAAAVPAESARVARAGELPIPIALSKDQATRNPSDVRFARETAKDPVMGQPLQEHYAQQNSQIQQNLQALAEQTGAQQLGVEPMQLGQQLVDIVKKAKETRKADVTAAYDAARAAGEMAEQVGVKDLADFVKNNASASKNAPVISAIGAEIKRLSKNGNISLNDAEELRKMISVLSQDSGPNSYYGNQALKLIDRMTEGKGGDLYKQARSMYAGFKKEFENTPIVREILSTKPGTTERTVALENLVDRSLIGKSTQEVQKLFGSLSKMEGGPEIINELKGALADKIAQEATKGVTLDINGKPYVSAAKLDAIIKKLDKGGKLDFVFGKQIGEQYRTLNQVSKDILTVPQGTTNPSGTASSLLAIATEMGLQGMATGVPVPIAMIGKHAVGKIRAKKQLNKINEFVNYGKQP
jgi:hypothetical protein